MAVAVAVLLDVGLAGTSPVSARPAGAAIPSEELTITDSRIVESSGLAASTSLPGVLWTINDSGDGPRVFGLDGSGDTVAVLTLRGARARDWEAVGVGPRTGDRSWLWVADIGDNRSSWSSVRVYRVPEPTRTGNRDVAWTAFELRFPDGPRDAEALLVDPSDGRLYVVSKRVQGAAIYRAPMRLRANRMNQLTRVAAAPPLVTDGSFSPDGRLAIRDYLQAYVFAGLGDPSKRVALPPQPQGESITWTPDGTALLAGSEGSGSIIWRVPVQSVGEPSTSPTPWLSEDPSSAGDPSLPSAVAGPLDEDQGSGRMAIWLAALAGLVLGGVLSAVRAARRTDGRQKAAVAAEPMDHDVG